MLSGFAVALFIMPYQLMLPGFADGRGRSEFYGAMVAVSSVAASSVRSAWPRSPNTPARPTCSF